MKKYVSLILKGAGMGAANVVPGVSGGTIALITGIFHTLIDSIKSFNFKAFKLLFTGKFILFAQHVNLYFLIAVFSGVAISIISIARLFGYLFEHYPIYIWSFFFGLILASVFYVGKTINKWNFSVVSMLIIGTVIAAILSLMKPASENSSIIYLLVCGVVGACSMILPGLSGSFVLILMGNYQLVMIDAVNTMNLKILLPVVIGAGVGLIAFSHFLSWIFLKFRNQTIALLTGFIAGSLGVLWPWKTAIYTLGADGLPLIRKGKMIVERYTWQLPETFNTELIIALILILAGIAIIAITERLANKTQK